MNSGYPQGSVLGPQIWMVVMNGLVEECMKEECEMIAYANDGAIILWSKSRSELESKENKVLDRVRS